MTNRGFSCLLGFILVFSLSDTIALSQDQVIVSSKAGECNLSLESNEKWHTLRLRAHHPEYKGCHIDKDSMLSVLGAAFLKNRTAETRRQLFLAVSWQADRLPVVVTISGDHRLPRPWMGFKEG